MKDKYYIVLNQEEILSAKKHEIEAQLALIDHKKANYEKF